MFGASGRQRADINIVREVDVPAHSLPVQRKISAILSAYDDLIENNTRRIKILEEMAQAIYREWFVHFRFPGHEGVKMVETKLGLMPEGWGVNALGTLVKFQKGKKPKAIFDIPVENSVPVLLIEGLRDIPSQFTTDESAVSVSEEDVIMVMDGASSGQAFIGKKGVIGSTIGLYRPFLKDVLSPYYLYLFLNTNFKPISDNNTVLPFPMPIKILLAECS